MKMKNEIMKAIQVLIENFESIVNNIIKQIEGEEGEEEEEGEEGEEGEEEEAEEEGEEDINTSLESLKLLKKYLKNGSDDTLVKLINYFELSQDELVILREAINNQPQKKEKSLNELNLKGCKVTQEQIGSGLFNTVKNKSKKFIFKDCKQAKRCRKDFIEETNDKNHITHLNNFFDTFKCNTKISL